MRWHEQAENLRKDPKYRAIMTQYDYDLISMGDYPGNEDIAELRLSMVLQRYNDRYNMGIPLQTDGWYTYEGIRYAESSFVSHNYITELDKRELKKKREDELWESLSPGLDGRYTFGYQQWKDWCEVATPQEIADKQAYDLTICSAYPYFETLSPFSKARVVEGQKWNTKLFSFSEKCSKIRDDLWHGRFTPFQNLPGAMDNNLNMALSTSLYLPILGIQIIYDTFASIISTLLIASPLIEHYVLDSPWDIGPGLVRFAGMVMEGSVYLAKEDPALFLGNIIAIVATGGSTTASKVSGTAIKATGYGSLKATELLAKEYNTIKFLATESKSKNKLSSYAYGRAKKSKTVGGWTEESVANWLGMSPEKYIDQFVTAADIAEDLAYNKRIENWIRVRIANKKYQISWDAYNAGRVENVYRTLEESTISSDPSIFEMAGLNRHIENVKEFIDIEEGDMIGFHEWLLEHKWYLSGDKARLMRGYNKYKKLNKKVETIKYTEDDMREMFAKVYGYSYDPKKYSALTKEGWNLLLEYHFAKKRRWLRPLPEEIEVEPGVTKLVYDPKNKDVFVPRDNGGKVGDPVRTNAVPTGAPRILSTEKIIDPDTNREMTKIKFRYLSLNYDEIEKELIVAAPSDQARKIVDDYVWKMSLKQDALPVINAMGDRFPDYDFYKKFRQVETPDGVKLYLDVNRRWKFRAGRRQGTHWTINPETGERVELIKLTKDPDTKTGILFKNHPEIPYYFPVEKWLWHSISTEHLLEVKSFLYAGYMSASEYYNTTGKRFVTLTEDYRQSDQQIGTYMEFVGDLAPYVDKDGIPINPLDGDNYSIYSPDEGIWRTEDLGYWIITEPGYESFNRDTDLLYAYELWPEGRPGTVVRVIDGDTYEIQFEDGSVQTVRLLGVDTPETHDSEHEMTNYPKFGMSGVYRDYDYMYNWGLEAQYAANDMLLNHTVMVKYDERAPMTDLYNRVLATVFYKDVDGQWHNFTEYLLYNGLGRVYPDGLNVEQDVYFEIMLDAQKNHRGMWIYLNVDSDEYFEWLSDIADSVCEKFSDDDYLDDVFQRARVPLEYNAM